MEKTLLEDMFTYAVRSRRRLHKKERTKGPQWIEVYLVNPIYPSSQTEIDLQLGGKKMQAQHQVLHRDLWSERVKCIFKDDAA